VVPKKGANSREAANSTAITVMPEKKTSAWIRTYSAPETLCSALRFLEPSTGLPPDGIVFVIPLFFIHGNII
jgi:hypothetical protein